MNSQYPNCGQQFLANRVIRLLQKSCAANEIGIEACWLVTCIALVEDAKHYSGPVTFWTGQLLPITGFASWGRLDRARERAVKAGWLYYRSGTNRQSGVYWCQIPDAVLRAFTDSPVDEVNHQIGDHQNGDSSKVNHQNGAHHGERTVIDMGSKRNRNGEPSNPVPLPVPKESGASRPTRSSSKFERPTVEQVKAYAVDKSSPDFDAEYFVDHYNSNGWRVGKAAMKDWQATVRKWIRNGGTSTNGKSPGSNEAETAWQNVLESLRRNSRFNADQIMGEVGEHAWQALRPIGLKKLEEANDFERRKLKEQFVRNFIQQKTAA